MKKIILLFAAGILISCGEKKEEEEIDLGDYNNSEAYGSEENEASDITEDFMPTDSTSVDSAAVNKDSSGVKSEEIQ